MYFQIFFILHNRLICNPFRDALELQFQLLQRVSSLRVQLLGIWHMNWQKRTSGSDIRHESLPRYIVAFITAISYHSTFELLSSCYHCLRNTFRQRIFLFYTTSAIPWISNLWITIFWVRHYSCNEMYATFSGNRRMTPKEW